MTLSNFDWTDKNSVKWFIMHPTGHLGPYSLNALIHFLSKGQIQEDVNVWAEGLIDPISLRTAIDGKPEEPGPPGAIPGPTAEEEFEIPPPLPPLPSDDEDPAFAPPPDLTDGTPPPERTRNLYPYVFGSVVTLVVVLFTFSEIISSREKIVIRRYPKMTPALHQQISKDLRFDGWDKKLFFKEYASPDLSHVWLVTAGFQRCELEAEFTSQPGKLLAMKDESISFKSRAKLEGHVAEFSRFDFTAGNKLRPGLYTMNLTASQCEWDGFVPKLANWLRSPDRSYRAKMNVILFSRGAKEFNQILSNLIRKKVDAEALNQNKEEAFWQDLQQKLQTLLAISMQIEQLFLDFVEDQNASPKALKPLVDTYTKRYGHSLTSFVVSNEAWFKEMDVSSMKDPSRKRNYEIVIRMTTKNIGFEAMRIIEGLQGIKAQPGPVEVKKLSARVRQAFSELKKQINQKIIQISEDRSR